MQSVKFMYSCGGLYRVYRVLKFMYSDGGLYGFKGF